MVLLSLLLLAAVSTTTLPMAISISYDGYGGDVVDDAPGAGSRDKGVATKPMLRRPSSQLVTFIDPEERRDEATVEVSGGVGRRVCFHSINKNIMFDLSNLPPLFEKQKSDTTPSIIIRALGDSSSNPVGRQCSSNQKYFKIDLRTDEYGFETSWTLKKRSSSTGSWTAVASGPPDGINYAASSSYQGGKEKHLILVC